MVTHPFLVAQQEDVIMECIDSEDITIRIKALDLVQGMVSSDNLMSIVSRLMRQLKTSSSSNNDQLDDLSTDSSEEMGAERRSRKRDEAPPLPEDYQIDVIGRILKMCSQNNYSSVVDFDWYIDVLTQLIRIAPASRKEIDLDGIALGAKSATADISESIGNELRNVAVKVKAVRVAAVRAAELIIAKLTMESTSHQVTSGSLKPVAWIAGEYAYQLSNPSDTLNHLLQLIPRIRPPEVLATCLQASMKLFALIAGNDQTYWTAERKSMVSLLMARVIHTYEPLITHPSLEVQERAVEFTELLKLTAEAASAQAPSTDELQQDPPLLLTQAIPSLFQGWDLNSVAVGAQLNVPMPEGLDLDEPIHPNLGSLLAQADSLMLPIQEDDEFAAYYNEKAAPTSISSEPAINRLRDAPETASSGSYQQATEDSYLDADIIARRKAERAERNRDDPFYIGGLGSPSRSQGTSTPIHNILQNENGPDLDIDSIPIMKLDLGAISSSGVGAPGSYQQPKAPKSRPQIVVAADETLVGSRPSTSRTGSQHDSDPDPSSASAKSRAAKKLKQSLLQVDSSHLRNLSLEASQSDDLGTLPHEKLAETDEEMAKAMKEVQRLRLEMQRANERIQVAQGVPMEGVVVKSKKKKKDKDGEKEGKKGKKAKAKVEGGDGADDEKEKKVKKKKKATEGSQEDVAVEGGPVGGEGDAVAVKKKKKDKEGTVKKKKPKRIIQLDDDETGAGAGNGEGVEAGEP